MARHIEYGEYGQPRGARAPAEQLATGLGWFSIGLGLAEMAAPGTMARLIGVRERGATRRVLQAYGAREIATGLAILQSEPGAQWLWARVGGDVMDIATLMPTLNDAGSDRTRVLTAIGSVAGVTALDAFCAMQLSQSRGRDAARRGSRTNAVHVRKAFTINRQPDVVYSFWRKLENLPRFMRHLESVDVIDDRRSHWKATAPAGLRVEWDAEIVEERPNERLSWRSLEGATVPNRGTVSFRPAPGARGTELRVDLEYSVPGGRFTALLGKLFGEEPEQQVADDLRRLKQLLEAGEIARSAGSTSHRQPAQPAPDLLREQVKSEGVRR